MLECGGPFFLWYMRTATRLMRDAFVLDGRKNKGPFIEKKRVYFGSRWRITFYWNFPVWFQQTKSINKPSESVPFPVFFDSSLEILLDSSLAKPFFSIVLKIEFLTRESQVWNWICLSTHFWPCFSPVFYYSFFTFFVPFLYPFCTLFVLFHHIQVTFFEKITLSHWFQ